MQKHTHRYMYIAALSITGKIWKQPRCPTVGEWIKIRYIQTMELLFSTKKK